MDLILNTPTLSCLKADLKFLNPLNLVMRANQKQTETRCKCILLNKEQGMTNVLKHSFLNIHDSLFLVRYFFGTSGNKHKY